jgi:hypothetical protein
VARQGEIFDRVWADVVVSDGALSQAVRTLRRTLGEQGERVFIRTVSRHGYQFGCPVVQEEDDAGDAAPRAAAVHRPAGAADPVVAALARLLDPALAEDARREAAEEPTRLNAEACAASTGPGRARAGPLRTAVEVPGRWPRGPGRARAGLCLRRRFAVASRWASASAGGAAAGALAGFLGGLAMSALGGSSAPSLLAALALVGAVVAGLGAAGVGCGLAAAEALVRSRRTLALAVLGAAGGGLVGALGRRVGTGLLETLFGLGEPATGGGLEGLAVGAAAGLGFGLTTRRMAGGMAAPRGRAPRRGRHDRPRARLAGAVGRWRLERRASTRSSADSRHRVRLACSAGLGEVDRAPHAHRLGLGGGSSSGRPAAGLTCRPRRPGND